jgi:hypothetical protein
MKRLAGRKLLLALALLVLCAATAAAQRFRQRSTDFGVRVPYDGRFTLARLMYPRYGGWAYDWPEMEHNLGQIVASLSMIRPTPDGNNLFQMDDEELLKYPIAYISEPGYWFPTDSEAAALRTYLMKGGFLIIDDFHFDNEWRVFEAAIRRVLPDHRIEELSLAHPVFHSFFEIKSLKVPYPGGLGRQGLMGEFYGIHEGSDPSRRLMVMINYNMDLGDYMEWSATGVYAVDPTNEAYKFFINYLVYGFTH